jgi:isoprenylcysteine carboxyl methyltransferase (ICMT) family protein YpbQ
VGSTLVIVTVLQRTRCLVVKMNVRMLKDLFSICPIVFFQAITCLMAVYLHTVWYVSMMIEGYNRHTKIISWHLHAR